MQRVMTSSSENTEIKKELSKLASQKESEV